jgi:hypothetical protein
VCDSDPSCFSVGVRYDKTAYANLVTGSTTAALQSIAKHSVSTSQTEENADNSEDTHSAENTVPNKVADQLLRKLFSMAEVCECVYISVSVYTHVSECVSVCTRM